MTKTFAPQIPEMSVEGTENAVVSFDDALDAGEALTGTPLVVEETTTDLLLGDKQVNTAALTLEDGTVVAIGRGVQWSITEASSGSIVAGTGGATPTGTAIRSGGAAGTASTAASIVARVGVRSSRRSRVVPAMSRGGRVPG